MNDVSRRSVRPRDAASVVLLRGDGPEVLMGRRRRRASFLPAIYVFPGGGVEGADRLAPAGLRPGAGTERLLRRHGAGASALALSLAALRETYEESGYLVARPGSGAGGGLDGAPATPFWQALRRARALPDLERLEFIARALTPASSPRRFNTRFFLAGGDDLRGAPLAGGELEDLRWRPLDEALRLPIIDVTGFVLGEALRRWRRGGGQRRRAPFLRYVGDRLVIRSL